MNSKSLFQKLIHSKGKISLIAILLLAAYLRLWRIQDYMTFLGDEGRDALVVKRMIVDHKFTLLGPTASVGGFFLGPIYYYFMAPFLWLFRFNPVGPAVMVALFGIATVYLVYRVGREFFSQETGLFAASLYALSPLVVAYSRSSWNPNLVPFFGLLYIYSLWRIVKTSNWRWWFLAGLCIGIGLQLHYLFTFLIPAGFLFLIIYRHQLADIKNWGMKILGILIGWSPFIVFELRHRFPNTISLYNFILHGQETGFSEKIKVHQRLLQIIFQLFSRLVFKFPPPEQYPNFPDDFLSYWRLSVMSAIIISLVILIFQLIKKKPPAHLLFLLWLIFGIGLFIFYRKDVYDYYLGIMFPLPFLLVGDTLALLWQKKFLKPLSLLLLAGLLLLNWSGQPFQFPPNAQLTQVQAISKSIFDRAQGKPLNLALITGQNSDHAYRYFLEIWGNQPVVIENFENDPERETVTDQLFVICEKADCQPLGHSLWEIAGFGRAEIEEEWESVVVKVYKMKHWSGQ